MARLNIISLPVCVLLTTMLGGCNLMQKETEPVFDVSDVQLMRLSILEPDTFYGIDLTESDVTERVAFNLAGRDYGLTTESSDDYSHELAIRIGVVDEGPTPVGFSYTLGNSDPRAMDFQKTEVIPVTCFLNSRENTDLVAELKMDMDARAILRYTKPVVDRDELLNRIVDKASTVCYNLLSGLDVPTQAALASEKKESEPGWMPEIVVENDPGEAAEKEGVRSDKPETALPEEPREKIIIRNEGTPVILEFGHERK